uniref:Polygalacturonase n=1 Tax=Kalanchoe fedtschenkoi TaxID=63787 RepID=A0A7N0ZXN7_KALFE
MANPITCSFFFILTIFFLMTTIFFVDSSVCAASLTYNVVRYGARSGGSIDSSEAFLTAWNLACNAPQPATTLYVPPGRFLLKSVKFQGPCKSSKITIRIDGTLVAPSDYHVMGNIESWLFFKNVDGVAIIGGTLDGQGRGLWDCKMSGKSCPPGATSLLFSKSKRIEINGLTSMNSQLFHIVINTCENVKVEGVQVSAPGDSPNTDGIHVQQSSGVTISSSTIGTGDDCVSLGPGTDNLWIENVHCGPGHGIRQVIGSLGKEYEEAGVQNVTVKRVTFSGTQNGVRIKSWARPSTGFVKNVIFEDITVENSENPIIIDQNYCPHNQECPGETSGIKISGVTYNNIHGTSASKVAIKQDCSSTAPCTNIRLDDVRLTYKNTQAYASCANAKGSTSGVVQPSSCLGA